MNDQTQVGPAPLIRLGEGLLEGHSVRKDPEVPQVTLQEIAQQMIDAGYNPLTDKVKAIYSLQQTRTPQTAIDQALEIAGRMHDELRRKQPMRQAAGRGGR
ncbi:MAG: hypothetical protein Q8R88_00135 [Desulfoprunum sp.]|nr:hypothetical protein [Desulfoprunum sp.]